MIVDNLKNAHLYLGLGPGIETGLKWLQSNDLTSLEPGRYDIDGGCFVLVLDYDTAPSEEKRWETHQKYIDIQYVASGAERIGWARVDSLMCVEAYDTEKDIAWYEGTGDFPLISEGTFMILLPHDAHMPGVSVDEPRAVRKVVVKVPV